jgi:hypothetical protein
MKKILIVSGIVLLLAGTVSAAEFIAPDGDDGNVTFAASETHKNLYTAGGNVTVNSNTSGDLLVAGGLITINGTVEQDLFAAGGDLNLNGTVSGDTRVAGGNISVNGPTSGDLLVAGGNISISERGTVGGDLAAGGGNISIDAPINGNVKIGGGIVYLNNRINGTVEVMADESLTFGPKAVVNGKIVYKGPTEAIVRDGALISSIEYTKVGHRGIGKKLATLLTVAYIIKLIAIFLAAWLLLHFWPTRTHNLANHINNNFLKSLGIGAAFLFATPLAAVLLLITGIGFYVGLMLLAAYALVLLFAGTLTVIFAGARAAGWYRKSGLITTWKTLLLGLFILVVLSWIPILGCLVIFAIFLACTGGLIIRMYARRFEETLN